MKAPQFTIGQPVRVLFSKTPFNVVGIERTSTTYCYTLQHHSGYQTTEIECILEPMPPLTHELTRDGRVRTKWGYFFSIRGGLSNDGRCAV